MSTLARPGHAVAAEQAAGAAALPHDRGVDDRARLDGLEREDLHARAEHGVLADEALVAEDDALLAAHVGAEVAGPADGGPPEAHARAEVGVVVDDDPLEVGAGAHPDVVAEHRVLAEAGPGLDAARVADDRRAFDLGLGVDLGALPQPHAFGHPEAGDVELDLAVEHVLVGPHVGLERADVLPVALGHGAEERLAGGEQRGEDLAREVDRPAGLDEVEDLRLEHEDAGVDGVAEHLAPRRLLEEPLDGAVVAGDDDAELERVLDRDQADGGQRRCAPRGRRRSCRGRCR